MTLRGPPRSRKVSTCCTQLAISGLRLPEAIDAADALPTTTLAKGVAWALQMLSKITLVFDHPVGSPMSS